MDLEVKDVAELLSVTESTIYEWLSDGKIPSYKINNQYRFSRIEIENWMMRSKLKPLEEGFSPFSGKQIYPPEQEEHHSGMGRQQFSLYRAIYKGGVFSTIPGSEKEEIIRGTMKRSAPFLNLDDEVISELLLDREKLMPTALNNGVAVPHTRDFLLQEPFDVILTVFPEKPVEYGALDGIPVHTLFFLFASSDKRHLHLLAKLAHLVSNPAGLELLKTKPDQQRLLDFVRSWEATLRH
jgi:nitrogen PTS system EIIA component